MPPLEPSQVFTQSFKTTTGYSPQLPRTSTEAVVDYNERSKNAIFWVKNICIC